MLHTTFRKAREAGACKKSYWKFAKYKGGVKKWGENTPFSLKEVLEVCGLDDALWALRVVIEIEERDRIARLFACDCAVRALPVYEKYHPDDTRPRNAIGAALRFAMGQATEEELAAAWDAVGVTAWDAAWGAAGAAARAAARVAAGDAAGAAARAAARVAAWDAAWGTAGDAAGAAAWDAAGDAAWGTERKWQAGHFVKMLKED